MLLTDVSIASRHEFSSFFSFMLPKVYHTLKSQDAAADLVDIRAEREPELHHVSFEL